MGESYFSSIMIIGIHTFQPREKFKKDQSHAHSNRAVQATGKTIKVNLDFVESPDFKVYAFNALSGSDKNPIFMLM